MTFNHADLYTKDMPKESELFDSLMALTEDSKVFFYKDYGPFRVFNYRLSSYSEFLRKAALDCRGTTFFMKEGATPLLVCRPLPKFFNLAENPFTMDIPHAEILNAQVFYKEDGSIISTYLNPETGEVRLKSKQNLFSEQSEAANYLLHTKYEKSRNVIQTLVNEGWTFNFEYVAPTNRIVLEYPVSELRFLALRNNRTGQIKTSDWFMEDNMFVDWNIPSAPAFDMSTVYGIQDIKALDNMEGVVIYMPNGIIAKQKTDWYCSLHHLKDSVSSERRLFESIIDERVDDVKAMFTEDSVTIDRITAMENKIIPVYNEIVNTVESFYESNKELDRKSYAILGQQTLGRLFSLGMCMWLKKEVDFKEFCKKYRQELFQISDSEDELLET